MPSSFRGAVALLAAGLWFAAAPVRAQDSPAPAGAAVAAPASAWQASLDAFDAADRAKPPPPGGVLFVGSSSIRLWDDLETQFETAPVVVKRGFGGSRLSDCRKLLARLVLPYRPRLVVVYAGDNDLAAGATPQDVLASFSGFVDGVRAALPNTRIAFVSIKPSPARRALMAQVREANALIAAYAAATPELDYIDVYTPMLDERGEPRAELFRADTLHLNRAGYALWHTLIAPRLAAASSSASLPAGPIAHAPAPSDHPTRR